MKNPKPEDAKTFKGTWCEPDCPHLESSVNTDGMMSCAKLGELDWYDGPLAKCEEEVNKLESED
jgi:hypothetical protein